MHVTGTVCAIVAASQLVWATAAIAGEPPTPTLRTPFRASVDEVIAAYATSSVEQDAAPPRRHRHEDDPAAEPESHRSRHHSHGMPGWVKYTLVGAAAAGGGYALSQVGHHGSGNDGRRIDSDVSMGR